MDQSDNVTKLYIYSFKYLCIGIGSVFFTLNSLIYGYIIKKIAKNKSYRSKSQCQYKDIWKNSILDQDKKQWHEYKHVT